MGTSEDREKSGNEIGREERQGEGEQRRCAVGIFSYFTRSN